LLSIANRRISCQTMIYFSFLVVWVMLSTLWLYIEQLDIWAYPTTTKHLCWFQIKFHFLNAWPVNYTFHNFVTPYCRLNFYYCYLTFNLCLIFSSYSAFGLPDVKLQTY
jgi:hypothetical protein